MVSWSHVRFPALIALAIQSGMTSCIRGEEPPPQGPDGKDVRCPAGHLQSPATRPLRAHSSFAHAVSLSTAGRGGPEPRPTLEPRRRGFPRHREPPPTQGPRFACVGSGSRGLENSEEGTQRFWPPEVLAPRGFHSHMCFASCVPPEVFILLCVSSVVSAQRFCFSYVRRGSAVSYVRRNLCLAQPLLFICAWGP